MSKLQRAAGEEKIDLFYMDGSGFSCLPNVQRAWSVAGKPHEADASVGRKRLNVLGALPYGPKGELFYESYAGSVATQTVTGFLTRLAESTDPNRLTVVVLDNASVHRAISQDVRDEWLVAHRMLLYFLPPYSPELNLIEVLWKQAKYHWRRFVSWTASQLRNEVHALLDGRKHKCQIGFG